MELVRRIAEQFAVKGQLVSAAPCGNGHINRTYAAQYQNGGVASWYIHQRINHHVFRNPVGLMSNIEKVTGHIRRALEEQGESDIDRRVLTLIPTTGGLSYFQDEEGYYWRTYIYVSDSQTYEVIPNRRIARGVASAFARFQRQLSTLSPASLIETIPNFHNTPWRFANLVAAIEADKLNRAAGVRREIEFALSREAATRVLREAQARGETAVCVTHNDTKCNNVLIDDQSEAPVCVIDLDTVMPGLALYDFGELVRTGTATADEDETNLNKVDCNLDLFEGLVEGYLAEAGSFLTPVDRQYLPFAGRLLTYENGIRFLTDYLEGDHYYSIKRPGHNLDRVRTQFQMVARLEVLEEKMQKLAQRY